MGVAAYNRGTKAIRERIQQEYEDTHPREFEMMGLLNSLPKYPDCGKINEPVLFSFCNNVWWINPKRKPDGFGYFYKTLHEAIKRWNVNVIGYDNGVWEAIPK